MEELSRVCPSTATSMGAHVSLCCYPIVNYGSDEQKQKYLPKLAKRELFGGFAITEPNAGSDAANQQTTAILDKDEYIINGNKIFITNGSKADIIMLDNMNAGQMTRAVKIIRDKRGNSCQIEASGNVSLENLEEICKTGVDIISVGFITHSAPAVDFSLELEKNV